MCEQGTAAPQHGLPAGPRRIPPAQPSPPPLLSRLPWLIRPRVPTLPWIAGNRLSAACRSSARRAAVPLWKPSEDTWPPWLAVSCQGLGCRASSCFALSTLRVLRSACFAVTLPALRADVFAAVFFVEAFFAVFFAAAFFVVAFFAVAFVATFRPVAGFFPAAFSAFFATFAWASKRLRMSARIPTLSLLRWLAAPLVPPLLPVRSREASF